ncbi:phosphopantetheine-binding protein [Cylindrospermum sp. FACHB-282]|uniref:phosphopantetheine-binding protein n=1 Tax=Cylindrospermum sp. FACHB-282 TaxID=2692794 RepID=UPI0016879097|nr:acyl carrier protein [Cylindrospermum sp. FACHB-282]MBD2387197.1 acyl carrier protein [Cylindrospermum sp. FACHB-282]
MSEYIPNSHLKKSPTVVDIQEWLVSNISYVLGVESDQIDIHEPLENYGLDSGQAMILASKAEKSLGFKLSLHYLWYYPTIEELAQRLSEDLQDSTSETFQI